MSGTLLNSGSDPADLMLAELTLTLGVSIWCVFDVLPCHPFLVSLFGVMIAWILAATENKTRITIGVSKGFLQSEVLGEVSALEWGSSGRSFCQNFSAKFFTKFSGLFCWDIQRKKNFSENFSPEFPWLCTAKLEKFQGKTSWRGSAEGPSPTLGPKLLHCFEF